jgi:hypothetical protein
MERGEGMLHPNLERELGRERAAQMRTEVERNRLDARSAREARLARAAALSEQARLGEGPPGRRGRTARGHDRSRHEVRRGAARVRVRAGGLAVAARVLNWTGPGGGTIAVGFDDAHFAPEQMMAEIAFADEAHPNLPDGAPEGTRLAFAREPTGHLIAQFKVGGVVYRSGGQRDLRQLWETVGLVDRLARPERYTMAS